MSEGEASDRNAMPGPPPEAGTDQPPPDPTPDPTPDVTVRLNGELCRVPAGLDLESVLRHLGHQPRLVVVEYNGEILPRARWAERMVGESDVLEVVTIVGGGS